MIEKFPKFVLYDRKVLIGRVYYHRDLLPPDFDMRLVYGGGFWEINREEKLVTFYGKSEEFGRFGEEALLSFEFPASLREFTRTIRKDYD